ncbi:MAG: hypothetical protein ACLSAF_21385 [Intestinimonas sp.]
MRNVTALNGDAEAILEGRSYRGWTLEATVENLLDGLAAQGYLTSADDAVDVAVNSKDADHGRALRETVERCVAEKLSGFSQPDVPAPSPTSGTVATPVPTPIATPIPRLFPHPPQRPSRRLLPHLHPRRLLPRSPRTPSPKRRWGYPPSAPAGGRTQRAGAGRGRRPVDLRGQAPPRRSQI